VENPIDEERAARIRQARQVLAGTDVQPPASPIHFGERGGPVGSNELRYLLVLAALLLLALLLYALWGMGPASVVFFFLALGLLAGWVVL
jgi:hypothetical protein